MVDSVREPLRVNELPIIEPEALLVQIPEQVKRSRHRHPAPAIRIRVSSGGRIMCGQANFDALNEADSQRDIGPCKLDGPLAP
jgi:hypothetical protein